MKTLTKKAIVLASAIAVAGTFAVCAASYTDNTVTATNPTTDNRSVTVSFSTDVAATDQITILAYYAPTGAETPSATNIVYIDQVQKDALSSLTFSLRDADATGAYKVLMGGTGVATAGAGAFTLSAPAPTGSTISGSVNAVINFGDSEEVAPYNDLWKTTVLLYDEAFTELDTKTVSPTTLIPDNSTYDNVDFAFSGLADGNYVIGVSRQAMCTKYLSATVAGGNVTLGNITLLGPDSSPDADGSVDGTDIAYLVDMIGSSSYAESIDPNVDYQVDGTDVAIAVEAVANFAGYQYWE